jgi:hypothetical protein
MTMKAALEAAAFRYTVTEADTAAALGSGRDAGVSHPTGARPGQTGHGGHGRRRAPGGYDHGRGPGRAGPPGLQPGRAELEVEAVLERVAGRRLVFAVHDGQAVAPAAAVRVTVPMTPSGGHHTCRRFIVPDVIATIGPGGELEMV